MFPESNRLLWRTSFLPARLFCHLLPERRMRWLFIRWWFWAGTGFMLVAVVAGYLVIPVSEGGINQATCDKIDIGLPDSEICNTLDGLGRQFGGFSFGWRGPSRTESWFDD